MWNVKYKVIPIVIGALGTIPQKLESYIQYLGFTTHIDLIKNQICWELQGLSERFWKRVVTRSQGK